MAWLVNEGVAPERILLLTFTRRAAREMLGRARSLVAMPGGAGGVVGGTFHSVAHRFVRMHASSLGLAAGFAVLDAGDAADLLDLIREEHGHAQRDRRFPKKSTLLDIYSRTVNAQRTLSEVVAESFPWCEEHVEEIAALLKAYTARKRALSALDLDDLLLYWRALAADEVIGAALEDAFDHVLIDEYQMSTGFRSRSCVAATPLPGAHRGRRRHAGDLRLALGLAGAHPRVRPPLPRGDVRDARAQLPLLAADPRRRQRGRRSRRPGPTASSSTPRTATAPARS